MEKLNEERIRILTERFEEDLKDLTPTALAFANKYKDKTIALAELIYNPNTKNAAPNYIFSIIRTILEGN